MLRKRKNRGYSRGYSYRKRVAEINAIYDRYARLGVSNREIWRRYIYPIYAITERQFYNVLNASADVTKEIPKQDEPFLHFLDDDILRDE